MSRLLALLLLSLSGPSLAATSDADHNFYKQTAGAPMKVATETQTNSGPKPYPNKRTKRGASSLGNVSVTGSQSGMAGGSNVGTQWNPETGSITGSQPLPGAGYSTGGESITGSQPGMEDGSNAGPRPYTGTGIGAGSITGSQPDRDNRYNTGGSPTSPRLQSPLERDDIQLNLGIQPPTSIPPNTDSQINP